MSYAAVFIDDLEVWYNNHLDNMVATTIKHGNFNICHSMNTDACYVRQIPYQLCYFYLVNVDI